MKKIEGKAMIDESLKSDESEASVLLTCNLAGLEAKMLRSINRHKQLRRDLASYISRYGLAWEKKYGKPEGYVVNSSVVRKRRWQVLNATAYSVSAQCDRIAKSIVEANRLRDPLSILRRAVAFGYFTDPEHPRVSFSLAEDVLTMLRHLLTVAAQKESR